MTAKQAEQLQVCHMFILSLRTVTQTVTAHNGTCSGASILSNKNGHEAKLVSDCTPMLWQLSTLCLNSAL